MSDAASAQELIGGKVEARVTADGAAGRPGKGVADVVGDPERGTAGDHSSGDEAVIAFHLLLVIVLGASAHVDCAYTGGGHFRGESLKVNQPGRVLAQAGLVSGEPANQQGLGAQAELGGDELVARVQDREQAAELGTAGRQEDVEQLHEPGLGEPVDVVGLPVLR
jgi:hypothetical protein